MPTEAIQNIQNIVNEIAGKVSILQKAKEAGMQIDPLKTTVQEAQAFLQSRAIPQATTSTRDILSQHIQNDPFLADQLKDPQLRQQFLNLPPQLQGTLLEIYRAGQEKIQAGNVINPNIELSPIDTQKLLDQASTELDPFFQEQLGFINKDLRTSLGRLQEDYTRQATRSQEPFQERVRQQAESEAQAGTAFSSGRVQREGELVSQQQQALDDLLRTTTRSAEDITRQGERTAGSRELGTISFPGVQEFGVSLSGYSPRGTRTLGTMQGGLIGELPKQREVSVRQRASGLEEDLRSQRILDLRDL